MFVQAWVPSASIGDGSIPLSFRFGLLNGNDDELPVIGAGNLKQFS